MALCLCAEVLRIAVKRQDPDLHNQKGYLLQFLNPTRRYVFGLTTLSFWDMKIPINVALKDFFSYGFDDKSVPVSKANFVIAQIVFIYHMQENDFPLGFLNKAK